MTDLLETVFDAHGGLNAWREVDSIDFRLTVRGGLLALKKQPRGLRDALIKIDARRPRTLITPFPAPGARGLFDAGRVRIESDDGSIAFESEEPRQSFAGHERDTPWTDAQFLYFIGYALRSYMTMPFLLAENGVVREEVEPHEEHGQTWRVLQVTFPVGLDVHNPVQKFYFDDRGLLMRNDYAPEVSRGSAAHYTFDHKTFDGFVFPTHRRVVMRDDNGCTLLTAPSIFLLDIESVVLTRR
jgi:hypothetical protein